MSDILEFIPFLFLSGYHTALKYVNSTHPLLKSALSMA